MPRRNSRTKRLKNLERTDTEDEESLKLAQQLRRTKSYPEELIRDGIKEMLPKIVIQPQTDDEMSENEDSAVADDERFEKCMKLAVRGRSNNNKRLKSCGQLQSALVTMAIRDGDGIQLWRLLSRKDVDVAEMDGAGMQPIHYACLFGNLEMVKILLQNDADLNTASEKGELPLDIAVREGNFEIAQYLVKKGAKVKSIVNGMMEKEERRKTYSGLEKMKPKNRSLMRYPNEV